MDTMVMPHTMAVVGTPKDKGERKRREILRELIRREDANLPSPTWQELGDAVNVADRVARYHARIMRLAGLVTFENDKTRTLKTTPKARAQLT